VGKIIHKKLVRDKIPHIIRADGMTPVVRKLTKKERLPAKLAKVVEEALELRDSDGALDEFADLYEIAEAAAQERGFIREQIEAARAAKRGKRGGFDENIFLEKVITPEDNEA